MAEQISNSREGLEERLPPDSIPGLFHSFAITGSLDIADFTYSPEEGAHDGTNEEQDPSLLEQDISHYQPRSWSLQPRLQANELPAAERSLFEKLSESRAYYHRRRMTIGLKEHMPSFAVLNDDVIPDEHEVHTISFIQFEIPIGHPEGTYEVQPGPEDNQLLVTGLGWPSDDEELAFDDEVTCFHRLSREGSETGRTLRHTMDYYITKEPMTIISDLPSFKNMFDHVAHETANGMSVDQVPDESESRTLFLGEGPWSEELPPIFESNVTLVRRDRSGTEHRHTTTATHFPNRKCVTRPSAHDDCSFVEVVRSSPGTLKQVLFVVPEEASRLAVESEADAERRDRLKSSGILEALCLSADDRQSKPERSHWIEE
ncbi:hypothetical protein IAR50_007345 [Cryptococcus sp. DSM 104548]